MYIYLDLREKLVVNNYQINHTWVVATEFMLRNQKQKNVVGRSNKITNIK